MRVLTMVLAACVLLISCHPATAPREPARTGDYLGETPPGDVPAIFAEGMVSSNLEIRDTTWSADGNELYYTVFAPDRATIVTARRTDGVWGSPEIGGGDLFISFRNEDGSWTEAVNMGEPINTPTLDMCPALSHDGKYLFWTSRRASAELPPAASYEELVKRLNSPANGSMNLFWVSIDLVEPLRSQHPP